MNKRGEGPMWLPYMYNRAQHMMKNNKDISQRQKREWRELCKGGREKERGIFGGI